MAPKDIHSFANFDQVIVRQLDIKLECDFDVKRFSGSVDITAEVLQDGATHLCLDVMSLAIDDVKDAATGASLAFEIPQNGPFGSLMKVQIPKEAKSFKCTITYRYRLPAPCV